MNGTSLRPRGELLALLFCATLVAAASPQAEALIIDQWDGPGTPNLVNTTPPPDDPGWSNVGSNRDAVYLGNQWMLTAKHAGTGRIDTAVGSFEKVPGTEVILTNPNRFANRSLDAESDIVMFRVGLDATTGMTPEELGMSPVTIADRLPTEQEVLTMMARGRTRLANATDSSGHYHWDVSGTTVTTAVNPATADQHGFLVPNTRPQVLSWGQNTIADPAGVFGSVPRSGNQMLMQFSNNAINDTIGFVTRFDRGLTSAGDPIDEGQVPNEAQAAGGDSGGSVFWKDDDEWVLAGVMHAIYRVNNSQPSNQVWFGSHTAISDLSDLHYRNQIEGLRPSDVYSILGDLDLDGVVTGDIVDGAATGDLALLVDNWRQLADPGVRGWMDGDLTRDGVTDMADFLMFREQLSGNIPIADFAALVAQIPEPATIGLATLASALLLPAGRKRHVR